MELQDKLIGELIGLARATEGNEHLICQSSTEVVIESLCSTLTNVNLSNVALENLIGRVKEEKRKMVPDCFLCASPCGKTDAYDMQNLWDADETIRNLKSLILIAIRGMAVYAYRAGNLGYHEKEVDEFFYKALAIIGMDDLGMEELLPVVKEVGKVNIQCMELLDKAYRFKK